MLAPPTHTDIFVSYAPADDAVLEGMVVGWVSVLVNELQTLINREMGKPEACSVWMAKHAPRNLPMDSVWQQPLQQAAVLLVILSPSYLNSTHCQQQLAAFVQRVGIHAGRIFVVESTRLERTVYPAAIRSLYGYPFWQTQMDGSPATLGLPKLTDNDTLYYQQLQRLARELAHVLTALAVELEPTRFTASANDLPAVFLAEVSDDLAEQRDAVKTYLQQHRIRVLPEHPHYFFPTAEQLQQQLEADMQQCGVFVQLLSGINPSRPVGMPTPSLQARFAEQAGHLQLLQWRSAALDMNQVTDMEQRALLASLHIVTSGLGEFKQLILQRCRAVQQQRATAEIQQQKRAAAGDSHLVFINADKRDQSIAECIQQYLLQQGMSIILPQFDDRNLSSKDLRDDLENNLTVCDAVIVLFGSPNVVWVRNQLLYCEKMRSKRLERPLSIILLAELNKPSIHMHLSNLYRINCQNLYEKTCIEQFLEILKI